MPLWDLTEKTPLLTDKKHDESGKKWDGKDEAGLRFVKGVKNVEYWRDVRPILDRSCVACHTHKVEGAGRRSGPGRGRSTRSTANLTAGRRANRPGTYFRLVLDNGQRNSSHHPPHVRQEAVGREVLGVSAGFALCRQVPVAAQPADLADLRPAHRWPAGEPGLAGKIKGEKLPPSLHVDFKPAVMPPPEAVAGTYVGPDGNKIKVAASDRRGPPHPRALDRPGLPHRPGLRRRQPGSGAASAGCSTTTAPL